MKKFIIPKLGIVVSVEANGGGVITSNLKGYLVGDVEDVENSIDAHDFFCENINSRDISTIVNTLESLILAHACAGIDVANPAYVSGIETTLEKLTQ